MLDDDIIRHLHSGCAVIVGTVSADGVPHASRGHGIRVVSAAPPRVRVMLPVDERLLANLAATGVIALTTADVRTLASVQMKGRAGPVDAPNEADLEASDRYTTQFVRDIVETDGHGEAIVDRWARVAALVVCDVEVLEMFDQTPGPAAGRARVEP